MGMGRRGQGRGRQRVEWLRRMAVEKKGATDGEIFRCGGEGIDGVEAGE